MSISFSFKNINPSKKLTEYCKKKILAAVKKLHTKKAIINVRFEKNKRERHVTCSIKVGHNTVVNVNSKGVEVYSCIDFMVDKIAIQLKKAKGKIEDKHQKIAANKEVEININQLFFDQDWDLIPIDADDLVKYEKARIKKYG